MNITTEAKPPIAGLAAPAPTVGRIVHFQTDERGGKRYVLPAIVTCTGDSHPDSDGMVVGDEQVIDGNPVPVPNTAEGGFVHLHVLTPGPAGSYTELTVPFDGSDEPAPRSWHWPPRT